MVEKLARPIDAELRHDDLQELRLDDRVAIVTGGARGLGLAISQLLLRRGARVCLVDRSSDALERATEDLANVDGSVIAMTADVSLPEAAERVVRSCIERWDRLDILVNNAGIGGPQVPLWEVTDHDWQEVMSVNLDGVFRFCRAAIPEMLRRGAGRIVNVASIAGKEGNAKNAQYSASKAAVIALTKVLGKELATSGILVNAVAPAIIETDIIRAPGIDPAVLDALIAKIPMARVGQPIEVARLVGFLVSDHLTFSTGAVYDISGGRATY